MQVTVCEEMPHIPPVCLVLTQQELVLPTHGTLAVTVLLTPPPSSVYGNYKS